MYCNNIAYSIDSSAFGPGSTGVVVGCGPKHLCAEHAYLAAYRALETQPKRYRRIGRVWHIDICSECFGQLRGGGYLGNLEYRFCGDCGISQHYDANRPHLNPALACPF